MEFLNSRQFHLFVGTSFMRVTRAIRVRLGQCSNAVRFYLLEDTGNESENYPAISHHFFNWENLINDRPRQLLGKPSITMYRDTCFRAN